MMLPFPAFPLGPQCTPEANKFKLQTESRSKLHKCYEHSDMALPAVFPYHTFLMP